MRHAAVLLVVLLAGCSSGGDFDPLTRFPDADQRFTGQHAEAAQDLHEVTFTGDGAVVKLSVVAPDGFDLDVRAPGSEDNIEGLGLRGGPVSIREVRWRSYASEYAGRATADMECFGPCTYTLAFDQGPLAPGRAIQERYKQDAVRFTGDDTEHFEFDVPPGVTAMKFKMSVDAPHGFFRTHLTSADGETAGRFNFPAVMAHDFTYTLEADDGPPATLADGEWSLFVDCAGRCVYAFGFDY